MTDQINQILDRVQQLDAEATAGPWDATTSQATMNDRSEWRIGIASRPQVARSVMRSSDAILIAEYRTAAPAMAAALRAVLGYVEEVYQSRDHHHHPEYLAALGDIEGVITNALESNSD